MFTNNQKVPNEVENPPSPNLKEQDKVHANGVQHIFNKQNLLVNFNTKI